MEINDTPRVKRSSHLTPMQREEILTLFEDDIPLEAIAALFNTGVGVVHSALQDFSSTPSDVRQRKRKQRDAVIHRLMHLPGMTKDKAAELAGVSKRLVDEMFSDAVPRKQVEELAERRGLKLARRQSGKKNRWHLVDETGMTVSKNETLADVDTYLRQRFGGLW